MGEYMRRLSGCEFALGTHDIRVLGNALGISFRVASWDAADRVVRASTISGPSCSGWDSEGARLASCGAIGDPLVVWVFHDGFGEWSAILPPCPAPRFRVSSYSFWDYLPGGRDRWGGEEIFG